MTKDPFTISYPFFSFAYFSQPLGSRIGQPLLGRDLTFSILEYNDIDLKARLQ